MVSQHNNIAQFGRVVTEDEVRREAFLLFSLNVLKDFFVHFFMSAKSKIINKFVLFILIIKKLSNFDLWL